VAVNTKQGQDIQRYPSLIYPLGINPQLNYGLLLDQSRHQLSDGLGGVKQRLGPNTWYPQFQGHLLSALIISRLYNSRDNAHSFSWTTSHNRFQIIY